MKKLLLTLCVLLVVLLVACDGDQQGNPNVLISNVTIEGNVFEADLHLQVTPATTAELKELVTSAVNQAYNHYKDDFGSSTYTLYFTVYLEGEIEAIGIAAYKVNASLQNPGLSYTSDNLALPA